MVSSGMLRVQCNRAAIKTIQKLKNNDHLTKNAFYKYYQSKGNSLHPRTCARFMLSFHPNYIRPIYASTHIHIQNRLEKKSDKVIPTKTCGS
jgi:hypothetical protein